MDEHEELTGELPSEEDIEQFIRENIHDQLPSVEEAKATIPHKPMNRFNFTMPDMSGVRGRIPDMSSVRNVQMPDMPNVREHMPDMSSMRNLQMPDSVRNLHMPESMRNLQMPEVPESFRRRRTGMFSSAMMLAAGALVAVAAISGVVIVASGSGDKPDEVVAPMGRSERVLKFLFDNEVSALPSLEIGSTPHHHAAVFIADGDGYQMELNQKTKDQFVERYVLALLYYHFDGPNWNHQLDFLTAKDHCDWWREYKTQSGSTVRQGVECNSNGEVIKLNLGWNNLSATGYPMELKFLRKLDTFHAEFNHVHSFFPEAFRHMPHLKSVALMKSELSGTIPNWIGEMTQLTALGLGDNSLGGDIPTQISKLKSLKLLGLDNNKLHGELETFKPLNKLEALYLEHNIITGNLEDIGSKWPKLKEIDVSGNMLDGHLDPNLLNHPELMVIDVEHNLIDGDFPSGGLENNNIEYLNLRNNMLHGPLPDRVGFVFRLQHLDLSGNQLTGTVPNTIEELTGLKYLALDGNDFMPQNMLDFSALENLKHLSLAGNNIIGKIPDYLGDLEHLKLLDLSFNGLSGGIPTWLGLLQRLDYLLLSENELTGTLPSSLSNMKHLKALTIEGNNIHGHADAICNNDSTPQHFSSDCYAGQNGEPAEINCRCCTQCCIPNDPSCRSAHFTTNLDPITEYGWARPTYTFDLLNAPMTYSNEQVENGGAMDSLP